MEVVTCGSTGTISITALAPGDPDSVYPGPIARQTESAPGLKRIEQGGEYYFKVKSPGRWRIRVLRADILDRYQESYPEDW